MIECKVCHKGFAWNGRSAHLTIYAPLGLTVQKESDTTMCEGCLNNVLKYISTLQETGG